MARTCCSKTLGDQLGKNKIFFIIAILAKTCFFGAKAQATQPYNLLKKLFPQAQIPYAKLATLPTPLRHLKHVGRQLQTPSLYLKDDSHTSPLFGGNKVRKLEFLLAEAKQRGHKEVVTVGAVGSNHATATAIHAQRLGLRCRLLLLPQKPTYTTKRNLLLMHHSGAIIHYCMNLQEQKQLITDLFKNKSSSRYFVPVGGSGALGDLGFVAAAFELKQDIEKGLLPEPDYIYICLGSGGSTAGLILGVQLAGLKKTTVIPVSIGRNNENIPATASRMLTHYYAVQKHLCGKVFSCIDPDSVPVNNMFINYGYAEMSADITHAVNFMKEYEGITLDTTYMGKVFAAMMNDIKIKKLHNKTLLLWNTFCNDQFTDIIEQEDYHKLPKKLHYYFEAPMDTLDIPLEEQKTPINMVNQTLPRLPLVQAPSPVKKLVSFCQKQGLRNLYLKDDTNCAEPFGGNKIRKLEYLLADAQKNNIKSIVTVGGAGSNDATATASQAQKLGLNCTVLLEAQIPTETTKRNLLLMQKFGATMRYLPTSQEYEKHVAQYEKQHLKEHYFIPSGGSTPLGAMGFIQAVFELKKQINEGFLPTPDYLYVPLGSGGTAVGLAIGLQLAQLPTQVVAVCISATKEGRIEKFMKLFDATKNFLAAHHIETENLSTSNVIVNDYFAHLAYAQHDPEVSLAIKNLLKLENIKLESTYSGKAFAAMIRDINEKHLQEKNVLFWNTFCSGRFDELISSQEEYKKLPQNLHYYFETSISPLDLGY